MPILLNAVQKERQYTPKFFSNKLTGSGKKSGLINEKINPKHTQYTFIKEKTPIVNKCKTVKKGLEEIRFIPVTPYPYDEKGFTFYKNDADLDSYALIGSKNNIDVYLRIDVMQLIYKKIDKVTELIPAYISEIRVKYPNRIEKNLFLHDDFKDYKAEIERRIGISVDSKLLDDYIDDLNMYDMICEQSENWQTNIAKVLDDALSIRPRVPKKENVFRLIDHLNNYNIPLENYINFYNRIEQEFPEEVILQMAKRNVNLLLAKTLDNIQSAKNTLPCVPKKQVSSNKYSLEQLDAITTESPLALVQAGAGTGKTHSILGRIDYMIDSGVKPEDIGVLSFTNAAADNITDRNPKLKSSTIARMIHTIYSANLPHQLSSLDTIVNAIDIYFPRDSVAYEFKQCLYSLKNKNDYNQINIFMESNYDKMIEILNAIDQTSLELEILICYHSIDTFTIPDEFVVKHLIVDETQDNSIFEFIYLLKFISKINASLFIIGDGSQTLYEFRASNPKALNILEGSGVFDTYQLQTNYRSNQEILDFANVQLKDIEANQYANIQLKANNLKKPTKNTFQEKVSVHYVGFERLRDFDDKALASIINVNMKEWIDERLKKKEQIAVLAYKRSHVLMFEDVLNIMYPDKTVKNLIPEKPFNSTIFSKFIKDYWNGVPLYPNITLEVVSQLVLSKLDLLSTRADQIRPLITNQLKEWIADFKPTFESLKLQVQSGKITKEEMTNQIQKSLIEFEIAHNTLMQSMRSKRNQDKKEQGDAEDADIVLSTIHSAKGLEFPHVILLQKDESAPSEENKRMYYVGMTRAKESEYILAYGTRKASTIEMNYDSVVKALSD